MGQGKLFVIGEAHLVLTPTEPSDSLEISEQYFRQPGGSPVNVAMAVTERGEQVEYVGKLGKDPFGDYIIKLLLKHGVGTSHLTQTHLAPTRVLFESYIKQRERFLPQSLTAGTLLRPDDFDKELLRRGDMIYFTSKSLTENPSVGAIDKAVHLAGEKGAIIVFAPQIMLDEWPNETLARETVLHSIPYAHLLVVKEEELEFLTGKSDEYLAIKQLFGGKTKLMVIMRGNKGITYVTERDKGNLRCNMEEIVDSTGMDDAFIGYLLSDLLQQQVTIDQLSRYLMDSFSLEERLEAALKYRTFNTQKVGHLLG